MKLRILFVTACCAVALTAAGAQGTSPVRVGGFVDGYYAYDFGKPASIDRGFTTQAARHNEFNINLAFVDLTVNTDNVRGRLALQAGTSVQANYAGEPGIGAYSGPSLARHIQEAVMGVRVANTLWVDGGIFLSHIGSESWISRDNPTYTRSIVAEYSPYYETGVKLTWQATPALSALVTVVNGWQIISENNGDKSVGVRLDWAASKRLAFGYYNLIGNEQPDSVASRMRFFNGVMFKLTPSDKLTVLGSVDVGRQDGRDDADASTWWGGSVMAKIQMTNRIGVNARAEAYNDDDQVIIVTGADAFRATGASIGLDVAPQTGVLWRSEVRGLSNTSAVFMDRDATSGLSKRNVLMVTSLAFTF